MYTVDTCRASTTLHMTQNGCTGFNTGSCLDTFCHAAGMSDTLCVDDDVVFFTTFSSFDDVVDQFLLIIIVFFWKQDIFCTVGDTTPQSQVTCISSHNFDNAATLMRSRSITYFVDCFHSSIHSGIKTDGIFCTCDVQVDGSRNTNCVDSQICQLLSTCKRTVTTDNYQTVNAVFSADICCFFLSFFCSHLCTTCCIQDRTTATDDIRYIFCRHIDDLFVQQSVIPFQDTFHVQSFAQSTTNNRTDRSIHSRSISSTCQYANGLEFFCHNVPSTNISNLIPDNWIIRLYRLIVLYFNAYEAVFQYSFPQL